MDIVETDSPSGATTSPNVLTTGSEPREGQEMTEVQELEMRERPRELDGSCNGPRYELLDHGIGG
jgi:hypothetical protein